MEVPRRLPQRLVGTVVISEGALDAPDTSLAPEALGDALSAEKSSAAFNEIL